MPDPDPDLPYHWTYTGPKHPHTGRTQSRNERVGAIILLVITLLLLGAGGVSLFEALVQQRTASRLTSAPVCPPGQQHPESAGCKLQERVTVSDFYTEEAGRSGYVTQNIKMQLPDGTTQIMYSNDQDFGLWSRLQVNEQLNAQLLDGNVVRLDDGAGHYMLAGDAPSVDYFASVLLLVLGLLAGGLFVRRYVLRPGSRFSIR